MPRLALWNMLIGFAALFFAACAGAFVATDMTDAFVRDPALLNTWSALIQRSAHGHVNLFCIIHIAFGLTLPYSVLGHRTKLLQTIGLSCGTFAMGPLMLWRAMAVPSEGIDFSGTIIGVFLSASLLALLGQVYALGVKLMRGRPTACG